MPTTTRCASCRSYYEASRHCPVCRTPRPGADRAPEAATPSARPGASIQASAPQDHSARSLAVSLVLAIALGAFGAHWFYLGRPGLGLARLALWGTTLGVGLGASSEPELLLVATVLLGVMCVWWFVDIVLIAARAVHDGHGRRIG